MSSAFLTIMAHPVDAEPYRRIRFAHFDGNGVAVYQLESAAKTLGAINVLKEAHDRHGGQCFYCHRKGLLSVDHVTPKALDGDDGLHNLIIACEPCNWRKADRVMSDFDVAAAGRYTLELSRHIQRSIKQVRAEGRGPRTKQVRAAKAA